MTGSELRRRLCVASLACVAALRVAPAAAQDRSLVRSSVEPTAADKATARAAMNDGRSSRAKGNLDAALKSFTAADALMHVPTTGLEVGRTLEALGRLVEARAAYRRVAAITVGAGEPTPFREALLTACALDAELEARIPTLTFVVPTGTTAGTPKVWVDGQPVRPSELGTGLRVDPGSHQIAVQLGQVEATRVVELRERERQPVVLKVLGSTPSPSPAQEPSAWRTVGYVSLGVSAAGLAAGAFFGGLALSTKRSAESACTPGSCPQSTWDAIDRARDYGSVSTVGFVTFGTALGVGLTAIALTPTRDSASIRVRPRVGLGYAEIVGTF
jgi:hypothetical protein